MSDLVDALKWWAEAAGELQWARPWDVLYDHSEPPGRWFIGGTLNVAVNCVDRYLPQHADAVALRWEGEPGDRRTMTFGELHAEVGRLAGALQQLGVQTGDRVALHLGGI